MGTRFFTRRSDRLDRFNRRYRWLETLAVLVGLTALVSEHGVGQSFLVDASWLSWIQLGCVAVFMLRVAMTFVFAAPFEISIGRSQSSILQTHDHSGTRLKDSSGKFRAVVQEKTFQKEAITIRFQRWFYGRAAVQRSLGALVRSRKEIILTLVALVGFCMTPMAEDTGNALHDGVKLTLAAYIALWVFSIIERVQKLSVSPLGIFILTYAMIILCGAALLMLPRATVEHIEIPFVDALFMSASASCVTGLSLFSIGVEFTTFGQIVLLVLIQIGGLGIMTFAAFASIAMGSGLSFRDRVAMGEVLNYDTVGRVGRLIAWILGITICAEAVGAMLLMGNWVNDAGVALEFGDQVYYSIFHSISAFCNAGFALHDDSLVRYQGDASLMIPISLLIVFGGLGFAVLIDLLRFNPFHSRLARKFRFFRVRYESKPIPRLMLQTKLVLVVTISLIVIGAACFWMLEVDNKATLLRLGFSDQIMASFFQGGVTPRTAGFNTLDYAEMSPSTQHFTMLMMFIGASPGSTAGGLKTTALAILLLSLFNTIRGRPMEAFKRRIRDEQVRRVLVMLVIGLIVVNGAIFVLSITEQSILGQPLGYQALSFEVVSAFSTTGLSTGITGDLSETGKIILSICMFLGRVGPVTLVLSLGARPRTGFDYPHESVMLG